MPAFDHLSAADLAHFSHRGWLFGVVPVYLGNLEGAEPLISTRNGVPDFCLDLLQALFDVFCTFAAILVPGFEPEIPIAITGRMDGAPLEAGL